MSFDLGAVIAHVKADITDFQNGINKAKGITDSFKGGISSLTNAAESFTQKFMFGAGIAGVGFTTLAKQAVDATAAFEQNRIAFETMLGSADKARTLLKELSDFAMKTPFDLPQIVEASQRLLAYNVSAEQIIPTMTMLGNISAGVGRDKLPQLILAFGQVKAATKLTGAELRQFSEAGVPLLQALVDNANKAGGSWVTLGGKAKKTKVDVGELNDKLAIASQRLKEAEGNAKTKQSTLMSLRNTVQNYTQKIGEAGAATSKTGKVFVKTKVTAAEMQQMISDGAVSFEQVQQALSGMTGEGGKFFNLMDKQSKTFSGTMSNLRDQVVRTFLAIMGMSIGGDVAEGSIFGKLKIAAQSLLDFVGQMTPVLVGAVNKGVADFSYWVGVLAEKLKPLGDWIMANQALVLTFLQGLAIAVGALLVIGTVTMLLNALLNPITLVILAIGLLWTAYQTNFMGIQNIVNTVVMAIKWLFENVLIPVFQFFYTWFSEVLAPAIVAVWQGFIMPLFQAFVDWFKERWDHIKTILEGAWNIISGLFKYNFVVITGIFSALVQFLTGHWDTAWETVKYTFRNAWEALKQIFGGIIQFIAGWGGLLVHELVKPFEDAWNRIKDFVEKIKNALDFTKRHSPSVVDIVRHGVGEVNRAMEGLQFSTTLAPKVAGLAVSNGGQSTMINDVNIDLSGAVIADEYSAGRIAENIGDAIIKKLQLNVRF